MKYINRTLEKTIKSYINLYPVIMVTGPRQVGKTTLLEYISRTSKEKINYITLDDMLNRMRANEDPETFINSLTPPVVIDEFQYAPNILSYIKIKIDEARKEALFDNKENVGTMYYLTGSQIFKSMKNVSESLAGRVGIFDLFALSRRELYGLKEIAFIPNIEELKKKIPSKRENIIKIFDNILKGSYPEIQYDSKIPYTNYYSNYIRTYMERDIRDIINIKNENKFIKFISSIAARTGEEYVCEHIARDVEIDNKTVEEWLSILKNTGIIYLLQPYYNNNIARIVKRPKIYFMDTGLACYLVGYNNAKVLENSAYNGQIFETYVVSEIIKSFTNNGLDPRKHVYYYRDNSGREIDLVILDNDKVYPVEIKKSANPPKSSIKNFEVVNKFGLKEQSGIVLCLTKEIIPLDKNNYYVPIEYI